VESENILDYRCICHATKEARVKAIDRKPRTKRLTACAALAAGTIIAATACGSSNPSQAAANAGQKTTGGNSAQSMEAPESFTIATGSGILYAPLVILKQTGWYSKHLKQTSFHWKILTG
jgi:hypothetical protein